MNKPRHSWVQQIGFRYDRCEHCGATRKWDQGFQRIMYFREGSYAPLYWAPSCKFVMVTDVCSPNAVEHSTNQKNKK
jgi:hypothetical protein